MTRKLSPTTRPRQRSTPSPSTWPRRCEGLRSRSTRPIPDGSRRTWAARRLRWRSPKGARQACSLRLCPTTARPVGIITSVSRCPGDANQAGASRAKSLRLSPFARVGLSQDELYEPAMRDESPLHRLDLHFIFIAKGFASMSIDAPILVTGAAGRVGGVGREIVEILRQRGLPARALVRSEDDRAQALRATGAEVVVGDLTRGGRRARFARLPTHVLRYERVRTLPGGDTDCRRGCPSAR